MVKYNGTVGRLKPCKMLIEGAWESGKGTGNRESDAESRSRLKVSSVGELTRSIGSLFDEMGRLTEKAAFLRRKRKLRWRNL